MNRIAGMHFYINISNLNEVVADEEAKTKSVEHSLHALDTFFSSIELFGKKRYPEKFVVEKITGSRLHMYVIDEVESAFAIVSTVSQYAWKLTNFINREIAKYKTLLNFRIQIGADYGNFYDFTFKAEKYEELTTIGYAANYAAKLQSLSQNSYISISSQIYEALSEECKSKFECIKDAKIKKYDQDYYATALISTLDSSFDYTDYLEEAKNYANKLNLGDINFSTVRQALNFDNLSKQDCRKVTGIPFFADIRGFTSQFYADDVNLEEMAIKTQDVLNSMYAAIKQYQGIHVQFQGDREMALFHNYYGYDCTINALVAGLKIIDLVKPYQVCVGVGQSLGNVFAAKIGTRGEKDNILLGSVVTQADKNEDEKAGENQVVISSEIYDVLKRERPFWAKQFAIIDRDSYKLTVGYKELLLLASQNDLEKNTSQNKYNGAWGVK